MPIDAAEAFSQALSHYHAGRAPAAQEACGLALAHDPKCVAAWNLLGILAYSAGEFDASLAHFSRALEIAPREPDFYGNAGMAHQALGRFEQAILFHRQALELNPAIASAHDNLGNCLHALQRYDEAIASHERAIVLDPASPAPYNNVGNSLLAQGKFAEAILQFHRALELRPNYAAAHNNLGMAFLRQGQIPEAAGRFQRAIELQPGMVEAYANLGLVYRQQGDLARAVQLFEHALERRPRYREALYNLGAALLTLEQYDAAIARFRQAAQAEPQAAEIQDRLGNALRVADRMEEARACFQRALELDPQLASAHAHLGAVWHALSAVDEAVACYRRALALDPRISFAHTSLAQALVARGEGEAALMHLRQAIEAEPHNSPAYWLLATTSPQPLEEPMVRWLEQLAVDSRKSDEERSFLHFALVQSFDKAGDYPQAMTHARSANALKKARLARHGCRFDRAAHVARIDELMAFYTPRFFAAARALGTPSELPVFIVGMPRSGTTLVEQILATHSRVHGAGELDIFHRLEPTARELLTPGMIGAASWKEEAVAQVRHLAAVHLQRLARLGEGAARVIDKMPTNFLHLGTIAALFPQARVIHCVRDPRDVLLSCYFQNFSSDEMVFTFDWDDLTLYWQQYERLMEHWRTVLPLAMHEVSYEELVGDQEGISRKLIERCGLPWESECLEFHKTPRTVATASAVQVREPIYTQSLARWRHYESQVHGLLPVQPLPH